MVVRCPPAVPLAASTTVETGEYRLPVRLRRIADYSDIVSGFLRGRRDKRDASRARGRLGRLPPERTPQWGSTLWQRRGRGAFRSLHHAIEGNYEMQFALCIYSIG